MYVVKVALIFLLFSISSLVYASDDDSTGSHIDLTSFDIRLSSRVVHIHFEVASEQLGQFFVIEKSVDQENWSSITTIASLKNHDTPHTYEASVIDFADAVIEYYRLIRLDMYGDTTELGQDIIKRKVLKNIQLIPVTGKAHKEIFITYDSMLSSEGTVTIMKRDGTIVDELEVSIAQGYNRMKLTIKNYEKGDYLITIRDFDENKISKRLVVYK
jgi:hypothetical protein